MQALSYEELIHDGIKDLPPEALAEVAHFVLFVRKRVLQPDAFADKMYATMLHAELKQLDSDEQQHLDEEISDYDRRYFPFSHKLRSRS